MIWKAKKGGSRKDGLFCWREKLKILDIISHGTAHKLNKTHYANKINLNICKI